MEIIGTATKVTIYVGESDRHRGKPLYLAILELLKAEDCAGATVTRGLAGFGAHSRIHTATLVDLSSDLPLVVEWIDDPARVERLLPRLIELVSEGLVTKQTVEVVTYGHRELRRLRASAPVHMLMSREVRTITPDASIADAMAMLIGKPYRALPVVNAQREVIGILTDGDLLARLGLPDAGIQLALTHAELSRELEALRQSGQNVQDFMVSAVITVSEDTPVAEAIRIMAQRRVKRLPVVDRDGRLTGMVSRVDVLRAMAQPALAETPEDELPPGHYTKVGDAMIPHVATVPVDAPLAGVVDLLVSTPQQRIVVIDAERRVLGIITDGDLLQRVRGAERTGLLQALTRRLTEGADINLARRSAGEVMTANPVTVTMDASLVEALQLLLEHRIKRLPVVDAEGRLVGLIGRSEILQALAKDLIQ